MNSNACRGTYSSPILIWGPWRHQGGENTHGQSQSYVFHGILVKPQEPGLIHVGQEHGFIFFGNIFPVCIMFSISA